MSKPFFPEAMANEKKMTELPYTRFSIVKHGVWSDFWPLGNNLLQPERQNNRFLGPLNLLFNGFPGKNRPGSDADHSILYNAQGVQMCGAILPSLIHIRHVVSN
jgi:hypothetical protein